MSPPTVGRNLPVMIASASSMAYRSGNFLFDEARTDHDLVDWGAGALGIAPRPRLDHPGHVRRPREDGQLLHCGSHREEEFYEKYQRMSGLAIDPIRLKWYSVLNCYQALVPILEGISSVGWQHHRTP